MAELGLIPELDPVIFGGWHMRSESCSGERSWYRYSIANNGGDLVSTPERDSHDFRRGGDGKRIDFLLQAPELYRQLSAAVLALRSYQFGNSSPDLAEEVADNAQALLAFVRGERA